MEKEEQIWNTLAEIKQIANDTRLQAVKTNGRVNSHDLQIAMLDERQKELKKGVSDLQKVVWMAAGAVMVASPVIQMLLTRAMQ